ncbi:hypothetical protein [Jiulongibacter sediminis]|nr:hypothetical protein [Jiulongibacter sediminis]
MSVLIVVLWDMVEAFIQKMVVRSLDSGTTENETTLKDEGLDEMGITNR